MQAILDWGVGVVRSFQALASPALTGAMKGITFLGTEWFFLAALPLIYWCVDRRRGIRLSILSFFSAFLNSWLKLAFAQPRPYDLDPSVGMAAEPTFGLPSGHAQSTAVFWGVLAPVFRRPWGLVLGILAPLIIGLSRIYLGVHFPTDVLAGWLLGGLIVLGDALYGDKAQEALEKSPARWIILGAALIALGMNFLNRDDTSSSGVFLGTVAGFVFADRRVQFRIPARLGRRLLCYLMGMAVTGILYFGLKALFPGKGSDYYDLLRFVRYGALGLWVSLGAPWVFVRLGLMEGLGAKASKAS